MIGQAEVTAQGQNPRFRVTNLPAKGFKPDQNSTRFTPTRATAGRVRLKLLKVAGQVRVSVRRVWVQLSSAYPLQARFRLCHRRPTARTPASG